MSHRSAKSSPLRMPHQQAIGPHLSAFGRGTFCVAFLVALVWGSSVGCRQAPVPVSSTQMLAGRTMGTSYSVQFLPVADLDLVELASAVDSELESVNDQMSTYLSDSEISRFNQLDTGEWFSVSADTAMVVRRAKEIAAETGGVFDVTVAPLVELWGFGTGGRPETLPTKVAIESALESVGIDGIEVRDAPPAIRKTNPSLTLDLSAIAKGHGVDRVAAVLETNGIQDYFVEIGGEVRVRGQRLGGGSWRVGIEQPDESVREIFGVAELSNVALATSGNYRNFFEMDGVRYSHTISPLSGMPVSDPIVSASVLASDCMSADAIATSMMSLGFERGLELAEEQGWAVMLMADDESTGSDENWIVAGSTEFVRLQPKLAESFAGGPVVRTGDPNLKTETVTDTANAMTVP
ncbi:MAG: FAD:protein FMN transferase [Planctomycetota bacterium]